MFHKAYPGVQTLAVDGRIFHNSGATAVQELAYALAQAAQLLDWATSEGIEASEAATAIRFNFSVGTLYFMEIAKFRAARYLWTKVLEGYGVQAHDRMKMIAHAETSRFNGGSAFVDGTTLRYTLREARGIFNAHGAKRAAAAT